MSILPFFQVDSKKNSPKTNDMHASLSYLACWEDTTDDDNVSGIAQVSSKPAQVSPQGLSHTEPADDDATQEEKNSMATLPCNLGNGDLVLDRLRCVVDHEHLRQSQSYEVSDCEAMVAKVRGAFEARKLGPMLDKFEKPLQVIDQFVKGITVVVQALDPIAQFVWGGFLIVLKNAARFVDLIDTILNCISTLSNMLARFQVYNDMYATERVETSLGDVCVCCVEFCAAASKVLRRGSIFNFIRLNWDPVDVKFQQLQKKIESARQDFMDEVGLQHAKETHELTKAAKPRGPRIPCHIMSTAKNRLFFPRPAITEQMEARLLPAESTGLKSFLLHGLGGSGKTQLAASFAYNHWHDYDIIIWAVADSEQSLSHHFLQAAAALDLPDGGDASAIGTNHKWLIIFDNVDNERLLRKFWPNSARGSILITSRQRILGATLVGDACEVGSLTDEQGASMIQLLLENKVSDAKDGELVAEMAQLLCGLPLALAQMAGYLRTNHVTVCEFLRHYKNREYARTLFGSTTSLDHEEYRQTLKTVWRLSFEKLSPDAQSLLRIAVFLHPDEMPSQLFQIQKTLAGMPLPPALQVLDKSRNALKYNDAKSSLTQQFLMKYNDKSALHDLLDEDPRHLRTALCGAVQVLYHAYPRQCPLGKPIPNWPACQQYTTHVLHLLSLYETEARVREEAEPGTLTLLTELFCDCGVYLWARGLFRDSERLARTSIEIAERVLQPHDCLRAQPYTLLGCIFLRSEDRREEAIKSLELALHIREENLRLDYKLAEPPLYIDIQLANAYSNLGIAAKQMGDFDRAAQLHERTIAIKERRRDHCAGFLLALSLHNMGKLRRLQGDMEEAARLFGECNSEMSIYKDDEEMKARQAVWLCSLAEAEARLGRVEDAQVHFTESLQTLKEVVGEALDTGTTCLRFGAFRYEVGRFDEAVILFKDAEKIFCSKHETALGDRPLSQNKLACSLHWLGRAYAQLGKEHDSDEAQRRAAELYRSITGKPIPLDAEEAVEEFERLVSDD
ncbi:hypothetical protein ACHAPT_005301 [Fusarium lateritium]